MKTKYRFLQPTYFKKFECIGSACEINCCNYNWDISIDKETYSKYKNAIGDKVFIEKLNKYVKRNRQGKTTYDYAKIVRTHNKMNLKFSKIENGEKIEKEEEIYNLGCIFQNDERLCEIYKHLGAEALSNTCKVYPRIFNNIAGNYERDFYMGCERVSQILRDEKQIEFESYETLDENEVFSNYNNKINKGETEFLKYFDDVRAMCIGILQIKGISMDDKVILLGVFMLKIDELYEDKEYIEIPEYIKVFNENIGSYTSSLNKSKIREDLFLEIFIKLGVFISGKGGRADIIFDMQNLLARFKNAHTSNSTFSIVSIKDEDGNEIEVSKEDKKIENPLKILEDGSVISIIYNGYKKNRDKLILNKEQYIENIFVSLFFSKAYPYNGENSIKDCFVMFAWAYAYYKGVLAGMLGEVEDIEEGELNNILDRCCVMFGRIYADQKSTMKKVLNELKENNVDNLAFLSLFIKSS